MYFILKLWRNTNRSLLSRQNKTPILALYRPMNYMTSYVMFLMRADPLRGQVDPNLDPEPHKINADLVAALDESMVNRNVQRSLT